jgi:feruloyl-CoA synthase
MHTSLFAPNLRLDEHVLGNMHIFRSSVRLPDTRPDILARLQHWADQVPNQALLTEPSEPARRAISYGEALQLSSALGAILSKRCRFQRGDVIATLAPASIEALVLKLACLHGGLIHAALPPFPFREGINTPAIQPFLTTIRARAIIAPAGHPAIRGLGAFDLSELVAAARAISTPEPPIEHTSTDFAAIFFTSGSTGERKAVPITRQMISSNQAAIAAAWPFMTERPLVLVDWLPWHHVFGGLDNIFKIIWNGGTIHIDLPPSEATITATVRLIGAVEPTMHIAVPLGIKLLLNALEENEEATQAFTRNLQAIFFAGAGIDAALWGRLCRFRNSHGAFEILSGYGTTEAASTICLSSAPLEQPGELGSPLPGHEVRLAETDGRLELRVRGPNVAPGYLTDRGLVPLPLDEHGFYRTGDAALLRKRQDGCAVLAFDGRVADDFKLSSGIKIRTGWLRERLVSQCSPLAEDILVAGENSESLVALVFPAPAYAGDSTLVEKISKALSTWNASNPGSSTAISRFAIASINPDRARGEISDKGQIVRSRFLRNHATLFDALHDGDGWVPNQ